MARCKRRMETLRTRFQVYVDRNPSTVAAPSTLPARVDAAKRLLGRDAMLTRFNTLCAQGVTPTEAITQWLDELFWTLLWLWWYLEKAAMMQAREQYRLTHPPGRYMGWFAITFFTTKTREMVIEPLIDDYRREVADAIQSGGIIRERYLDLLYGVQFVKVAFGKWILAFLRLFFWWH